jgi:sporulation integral membrane protein YlbJ
MKFKRFGMVLLPLVIAALNIMIIIFPRESLAAARDGMLLWSQNILPGILPFVIGANLLMALGGASFLGELFSPIMRAIFKVPGTGGFALAIGLMSGYPVGTKVVCEMRTGGQLTKAEAQRLVAFTSNAGPLFILGAVGTGMFGSAPLGYFMLAAHYLGSLSIGLLMRFYKSRDAKIRKDAGDKQYPLHIRAFRAMETTRHKDGRNFGLIFGHSIKNAVETMLVVGGFVILFSVVSSIFQLAGVFYALSAAFGPILQLAGVPQMFHVEHFAGMVEMTNGVNMLSAHGISRQTAALGIAIISFGGLSILFQSVNFISKTDISIPVFVVCKAVHGVLAGIYAAVLYPFFARGFEGAQVIAVYSHSAASRFIQSSAYFAIMMGVLLVVSLGIVVMRSRGRGMGRE